MTVVDFSPYFAVQSERGVLFQDFLEKVTSNKCYKKPPLKQNPIWRSQCNLKGTQCLHITLTSRIVIGMGNQAFAVNSVTATMN